jgi:hypothetical protein
MIRHVTPTLTFILGLAIGVAATYEPTREKWRDIGRVSGVVEGKAEVMEGLCAFAQRGFPANASAYGFDVKADRLELYRDDDGGVRLYCSR